MDELEQTDELYQLSDYQLTVEVSDLVFTESEFLQEATATDAEDLVALTEEDAFVFTPMEPIEFTIEEELVPQLTEFEQNVIDAILSQDFDPFSAIYANPDGSINMEMWWTASSIGNNLVYNGIALEDYAATAADWLSAYG